MSDTRTINDEVNSNHIDNRINEVIRNFEKEDERHQARKKDTIFELRDLLIMKGSVEHHTIAAEIIRLTKGKIDDRYVREVLGQEFTNPAYRNKEENKDARFAVHQPDPNGISLNGKDINLMTRNELREYSEQMKLAQMEVEVEMQKRKIAPEVREEDQGLPNKSVTGTPLHDEQITKPKYLINDQEKIYQDIVDRAAAILEQRIKFIRAEFIPNLKIKSEQEARSYAEGFMWNADLYKPTCDEKYRLSLIDWSKIIKLYMIHGSSAASKLFKKPIADIKDIDPETLPAGFNNTILALKFDESTGNRYYISPTKEHIDSKINFILERFTEFINRIKPVAALMEMIESEVELRNFRAEVLSEKLSDSK